MKPLEIPVYFMAEDDAMKQELGLPETPVQECPLKKLLLVNIDSVGPYVLDNGVEITKIISGCGDFLTPIPYPEMVELIERAIDEDVWTVNYEK